MDDLKNAMHGYMKLTQEIDTSLENDDYDKLDELLDKREDIISNVNTLKYSNEEFKNVYEEIGLAAIEEKLKNTFTRKHAELKSNLNAVTKGRNVNKIYSKKFDVDAIFFNKKL